MTSFVVKDVNINRIYMKINRLHFALLIALACAIGLFFGYKMGVKMRNGDNRVLYPKAEQVVTGYSASVY